MHPLFVVLLAASGAAAYDPRVDWLWPRAECKELQKLTLEQACFISRGPWGRLFPELGEHPEQHSCEDVIALLVPRCRGDKSQLPIRLGSK